MNDLLLRRVPLERVFNFRSLGGYAADGGQTRHGVLYRCGWLSDITQRDRNRIKALGVRTVMDLRDATENDVRPNAFLDDPDVTVQLHPLLAELDPQKIGKAFLENPDFLQELYIVLLRDMQAAIRRLIGAIADRLSCGAVLFHCSAGKDRTGLTAMLLLSVAGVDRDDIVADYQVSETYIKQPMRGHEHGQNAIASPARYIEHALDYLDETYGGATAYLKAIGVTQTELDVIRRKLVERY